MGDIRELTEKVNKIRDDRDWRKFTNPKDLALSLVLEVAEVLEHFQWKSPEEIKDHIARNRVKLGEELADVAIYVLELASDAGIDLKEAVEDKLKKVEIKYPIGEWKGKHSNKYDHDKS